jgi:hypothetical protein
MPLSPGLLRIPLYHLKGDGSWDGKAFPYPYDGLPLLECHIPPTLAVINGGPKLANLDLDAISLTYHRQESNTQIKERLTLLSDIWKLITDAKELAKEWERENCGKKRKRSRDDDDGDASSQRTGRTRRSSAKSRRQSELTHQAIGGTQPKYLGTRKLDRETMSLSTTLTGDVLAQLGKGHKIMDRIKVWVEATARRRPKIPK